MVTKIKTLAILSTAAATLFLLAVGTIGRTTKLYMFTAKLYGSREVPPVTTAGSGIANFRSEERRVGKEC